MRASREPSADFAVISLSHKIVGDVQDFGKRTVFVIWASPVLLSATGSVCAATVAPHTAAAATASTPSRRAVELANGGVV
jgi:hypothetical protein